MAKKGYLAELAEESGTTTAQLVRDAVMKYGAISAAARELGVSTNAIYYHLRGSGLTTRRYTRIVKANSNG